MNEQPQPFVSQEPVTEPTLPESRGVRSDLRKRVAALAFTALSMVGATQIHERAQTLPHETAIEFESHQDGYMPPAESLDSGVESEVDAPLVDMQSLYDKAEAEVVYDQAFKPSYNIDEQTAADIQEDISSQGYVTKEYLKSKYGLDTDQVKAFIEQNDVERMIAFTNASHIASVELKKSGLKFNFFKENVTNGDEYDVSIDPKALAVMFETVMESLNAKSQTYISPERVSKLIYKSEHRGFENVTMNIILSNDVDSCVENSINGNPYVSNLVLCQYGGFASNYSPNEPPRSDSIASNPLVVLGGPTGTFTSSEELNSALVHETAHTVASLANMTLRERMDFFDQNDAYYFEHHILTRIAQETFKKNAKNVSPKSLATSPLLFTPKDGFTEDFISVHEKLSLEIQKQQTQLFEYLESMSNKLKSGESFEADVMEGVVVLDANGSDTRRCDNPIVYKISRPGATKYDFSQYKFIVIRKNDEFANAGGRGGGSAEDSVYPYYVETSPDTLFYPDIYSSPKHGGGKQVNVDVNLDDKTATKGGPESGIKMEPVHVTIDGKQDLTKGFIFGRTKDGRMIRISTDYNGRTNSIKQVPDYGMK